MGETLDHPLLLSKPDPAPVLLLCQRAGCAVPDALKGLRLTAKMGVAVWVRLLTNGVEAGVEDTP